MHSVLQELKTREKGVDLCILMDGTGSMVSTPKPEEMSQSLWGTTTLLHGEFECVVTD